MNEDDYRYQPVPTAQTDPGWLPLHTPPYVGWNPPPPPPPNRPSRARGALIGLGSAVAAAALVLGGLAVTGNTGTSVVAGSGSVVDTAPVLPGGGSGNSGSGNSGSGSGGTTTLPGGSGTGSTSSRTGAANGTQQIGIVTIVSTLRYQNAQSAGTGMVLSSDGEVLTNNHVIRGATSIVVTVETTGKSYRATVVGTAPTKDVAVLKLTNASGLRTANLADSAAAVQVGDAVVGVGNAGGTGTLTAATGKVTALGRSITASDETGQDAERLTGLIQINADIISGDSGGPLYDSGGHIIGIDTAASANRSVTSSAYAIPIENAIAVADQIETGVETAAIHIGYPGFLGVSTQNASGQGAAVAALLDGGPAASAGVTAGSVITAVDGQQVASADGLKAILTGIDPGSSVKLAWTDASGNTRSATVTLATGPAD